MSFFVNTAFRSEENEIMDDFTLEGEMFRDTLDKLETINRLLGGNVVTINGVKKLLKDQPKDIQNSIMAVPVIVILDQTGRVRMQYVADISLQIKTTNLEIQNTIDRLKRSRRASTN
jgi:hypothetical protein